MSLLHGVNVCGVFYKLSSEQVKLVLLVIIRHNLSITPTMILSNIINTFSSLMHFLKLCVPWMEFYGKISVPKSERSD